MSKHVVCWLRACIRVPGVIWLEVREQGFLCWVQVVRLSVSGMPLGGWGCQERFTVETLHSCSQGQPFINCDELFFISLPQFISSHIFLGSIPFFQYHHFNAITTTHLLLYSFNNLLFLRKHLSTQSSLIGQRPDTWWPYFLLPSDHPYHLTHLSQALSFNGLLIN